MTGGSEEATGQLEKEPLRGCYGGEQPDRGYAGAELVLQVEGPEGAPPHVDEAEDRGGEGDGEDVLVREDVPDNTPVRVRHRVHLGKILQLL
jgi:hypothetical protein